MSTIEVVPWTQAHMWPLQLFLLSHWSPVSLWLPLPHTLQQPILVAGSGAHSAGSTARDTTLDPDHNQRQSVGLVCPLPDADGAGLLELSGTCLADQQTQVPGSPAQS